MHIVVVTGSRDWQDRSAIFQEFCRIASELPTDTKWFLLHGDARGADRLAAQVAAENWQFDGVVAMPADWATYGRSAGPRRNQAMLDRVLRAVDNGFTAEVVAFPLPQSRGTRHMIDICERAGLKVTVREASMD